ncbi:type II toxin-antitoxin system prevent-host-death family antitoxin [Aerococcaceae bacterium DSM 109653]|uniref:Antitoxin n=2 Tax=Fundicoccus ignavus TaxID=2664442 RepID=A0A6I2GDP7_9LACT|nr:type II toxin-antitoxin system prevent-host-death family antitoxin [Fundicoccus ignavus]MRI80506.1 type II toxin-antitoxin system prevent-host-death family antitoxin [Fundicoccus ignavus]MRI84744.1 type II toxin-antitoxin system prevent-host-death family antitoxin [Fundicoccus ignavus]
MEVFNPTNARKNLNQIIKDVVSNSQPVEIASMRNESESVIVVSKKDWNAIQETLYLQQTGVLDVIEHHEDEEAEVLG